MLDITKPEPAKRDPLALVSALTIRAQNALEKAGRMQPGGERAAAMKKATVLANAAEILRHFSGTASLPAK